MILKIFTDFLSKEESDIFRKRKVKVCGRFSPISPTIINRKLYWTRQYTQSVGSDDVTLAWMNG